MMSDRTTIDLVATTQDGKIIMAITEYRNWSRRLEEMHRDLWNKLNAYVGFVLSEEFSRQHPGKTSADVQIKLMTAVDPPPETLEYLAKVRRRLERFKIAFQCEKYEGIPED